MAFFSYAGLNLSYQRFYQNFGIVPEDLGIDQVFILGRALAIAITASIFTVPVTAICALFPRVYKSLRRNALLVVIGLLLTSVAIVLRSLYSKDGFDPVIVTAFGFFYILPAGAIFTLRIWRDPRRGILPFVAIVAAFSVLGGTIFAWNVASLKAESALDGYTIKPVRLGPFILLDIRVDAATIEWVGPSGDRPSEIFHENAFANCGYLGQNSSTVFAICGKNSLRLPSRYTAVAITS